jgi:ATP-dependent Lhr-like helicase
MVEAKTATVVPLSARLHPALRAWVTRRFGRLAPAQELALPHVLARRDLLLTAPTGSGKTLAAFLGVFDGLARAHDDGGTGPGVLAIYVSPLRALAYDIEKNLRSPLQELGWPFVEIGIRTGDTTAAERARLRRRPPHILVTTPESLLLLLAQPAQAAAFARVRWVIVDELHALAESKRGSLLALALEQLAELRAAEGSPPPVRIGLSATVHPLPLMRDFLCGPGRTAAIVEVHDDREPELEVFSPLREHPYPAAGYTGMRIVAELRDLIETRRTTLVFTNTRSGAEAIGLRLRQAMPKLAEEIEVHHGSLDRSVRLDVEDRLKRGELRAVVCSTSLELGIDIGSVDTVVMVGAPKGVARALQRIGRSGHSLGESSHGVLVATNINDLAECVVTRRAMRRRELEPLRLPENPVDVLAQFLTVLAVSGNRTPDEAFALVRRSHPFHSLRRADFDRVLRYLEGGGAALERQYRPVFGKVTTTDDGRLGLPHPRVARELFQNIGTINSDAMVTVRHRMRRIGQVEESFVKRLCPGDVFVLQGRPYRLLEAKLLEAKVEPAKRALPTVPRWNANKIPLASGLARDVSSLRGALAERLAADADDERTIAWLEREYTITTVNAAALVRQFRLQARVSRIPTPHFLLVEIHADGDLRHVVFHALVGRAVNDALSRIVARRVRELHGGNALVTIDDYGFLLGLRAEQLPPDGDWRPCFAREGAEEALRAALLESQLVKWQFRGVAQTALMVPRRLRGEARGQRQMQWSAEIIHDVLRRHEPDHPLLEEAFAEASLRFLDREGALAFLDEMRTLPITTVETPRISPFAFGIHASRIRETMMMEDPEAAIERLFHEMHERLDDHAR